MKIPRRFVKVMILEVLIWALRLGLHDQILKVTVTRISLFALIV